MEKVDLLLPTSTKPVMIQFATCKGAVTLTPLLFFTDAVLGRESKYFLSDLRKNTPGDAHF
jgi:hypothetical protein